MAIEGKACRYRGLLINALSVHLDLGQMARTGKRTIVHCPRGIQRRSEAAERNLRLFFLSGLERLIGRIHQPWGLGHIYIERAMELKLNGIALNRFRNHTEDK